jgi:hypothetical protein
MPVLKSLPVTLAATLPVTVATAISLALSGLAILTIVAFSVTVTVNKIPALHGGRLYFPVVADTVFIGIGKLSRRSCLDCLGRLLVNGRRSLILGL